MAFQEHYYKIIVKFNWMSRTVQSIIQNSISTDLQRCIKLLTSYELNYGALSKVMF